MQFKVKKKLRSVKTSIKVLFLVFFCSFVEYSRRFAIYLNEEFPLPPNDVKAAPELNSSMGRPSTSFSDSSDRTKRRKLNEITSTLPNQDIEVLLKACAKKKDPLGKSNLCKLINLMCKDGEIDKNAEDMWRLVSQEQNHVNPLSDLEATALLLHNNITRQAYQNLRDVAKSKEAGFFPSYKIIQDFKQKCEPPSSSLHFSPKAAYVDLEALMHFTLMQLVTLNEEVIESQVDQHPDEVVKCFFHSAWGLDSSSSHSNYKQFSNQIVDDSSLFAVYLNPLKLETSDGVELWFNENPQSTHLTRTLFLGWIKETKASTRILIERYEKQSKQMQSMEINLKSGRRLNVKFCFYLTMIDGKVLIVVTGANNTTMCPLCKAPASIFNNQKALQSFFCELQFLLLGLSSMHACIKLFEVCLKLA